MNKLQQPSDRVIDRCLSKDGLCPVLEAYKALKIENEQLLKLSHTDTLTRYYNYRYLMKMLHLEMERTRRTGVSTGLSMIDLDHFKRVNDVYGHEVGNQALKWASSLWRKRLRIIDVPCRYGGEEFAVILPGTSLAGAIQIAEQLRKELEHSPLVLENDSILLTASMGVESFQGNSDKTVEALIETVDGYLYRAKAKGRNQVGYDEEKIRKTATEISSEERDALFPVSF